MFQYFERNSKPFLLIAANLIGISYCVKNHSMLKFLHYQNNRFFVAKRVIQELPYPGEIHLDSKFFCGFS